MSLDRMDVRAKLDAEMHAKLKAICEFDGIDIGEFIEALLIPVIEKRCHVAIGLADRLQRLGKTGKDRE